MKERPILFSGEMVRAILEGRKTQTRRVVKHQPVIVDNTIYWSKKKGHSLYGLLNGNSFYGAMTDSCPYGQPGDRLWVRETWLYDTYMHDNTAGEPDLKDGCYSHRIIYRASRPDYPLTIGSEKWKPSIYMRREYSRINLEITNIRVERLQDISEEDAKSEGAAILNCGDFGNETYRSAYKRLWEKINSSGSWDKNPWVWVVEFKREG